MNAEAATRSPLCVALGVSATRTLIYILEDGSEVGSTIPVVDCSPGERFEIEPRELRDREGGR